MHFRKSNICTYQFEDRNHCDNPDQFPRFEVGIDKLIALSSLSIFHCQSQKALFLKICALVSEAKASFACGMLF